MNNSLQRIILGVTDDCNLRCKYCFVKHQPKYMTLDIAKDSVDFLININKDNNELLFITFFGGEPLLCWDSIILPLIKYCKETGRKFKYDITTNGILLTEEKLKIMKDNNFDILLSMDGGKNTQDFNRPFQNGEGSFDILKKNIPNILKYFPNTPVRATLYPNTSKNMLKDIIALHELGFKTCFFAPDMFSTWNENDILEIEKNLKKYSIYFIDACRQNQFFILLTPISNLFNNVSNNINNNNDEIPCGFGKKILSINANGDITTCQEMCSLEENKLYYIGNIYTGIDIKKYKQLLNEYLALDKIESSEKELCKNCLIKDNCLNGFCHASIYMKDNQITNIKPSIICKWSNLIYKYSVLIKTILTINNNDYFASMFKIKQ